MRQLKEFILLLCKILIAIILLYSCSKNNEHYLQDANIKFSVDTLFIDTVFTDAKSSTHVIKLYNTSSNKVKVDVALKNSDNSFYNINIDNKTGKIAKDIVIAGNDSAIIFVTMLAAANTEDAPFIIEDELIATNGYTTTQIPIIGYGQNAIYITDSVLSTSTWDATKPYVIINSALIPESNTLTIPSNTKIYMHRNSRLYVQGTLLMQGTREKPIIMQGDRIDRRIYVGEYNDVPGEWGGIYFFKSSHNNLIEHAIIKNGGLSTNIAGTNTLGAMIQLDEDEVKDRTPKLTIKNSIIKNSIQYGIIAFNSSLYAENTFIVDCQNISLALLQGGNYELHNNTIGTWGNIKYFSRITGSISTVIQNYYQITENTYIGAPLKAIINNCILYGSGQTEFYTNKVEDYIADISINNSLLKHKDPLPTWIVLNNTISNIDPLMKDPSISDYNIIPGSPIINKGIKTGTLLEDYNGILRPNPPSIGAVEPINE